MKLVMLDNVEKTQSGPKMMEIVRGFFSKTNHLSNFIIFLFISVSFPLLSPSLPLLPIWPEPFLHIFYKAFASCVLETISFL